ncbi:MAG: hypothetical protein NTV62_01255 [Candidatus Gribaldobacteria bacterium]|nr:hypothetical protein [Candidatus Gribaldobacteria bacterium]
MLKISRLKIKIGLTGLMILGVLILVLMPIQQVKAGWLEENIAKLTKMLPIPGSIIYDNNGSLFFGTIFKACPYKEEIEDCTDPNCIRADKCNSNGDCKNITCETGTKFCNKSGDKDTRNNNEGICACASCEDKKYALGWPADANPNCTFIENGVNKTMCPIIKESDKCLKKANGKCQRCENIFNQFQDTWRITDKNGKTKDYFQTAVLDDQTGRFKVPTPVLPSECELGMVETDPNATPTSKTQAERLSKARSCLSLEQLQREAAQAVFQAKLLYNATDPFSTCNFLGTCKSACFLKFGTIAYTVTMADVLKTVVPGGALLWAQKIYKLVKIFQKIKSAVDTAKGLYKAVDTLVNNVWGLIKQASNLYLSLDNIGLKWSDALGPLASSAIQGEDRGPVAAWGGLMKIIDDFASGLAGFSVAKSEAISTIDVIEQNMRGNIKGKIMEAPELSFLFAKDNANKKALNQMMNNYFKALTSMNTIFDDVITNILTVPSRQYQKQECGADVPSMDLRDRCISCYSCIQNPNPKLTDLFSFPEIFTGPSTDAKRCGNLFRRFPYFCPLPSSGTGRDVRDGWNQVCDPLFKPNQDFIAETNEGFFGWVNGLFENKEERNIDKRFNRWLTNCYRYCIFK